MGIRVLKVDFRDKLNMKVIPISTSITFFINNLLSQFRLEELFGVLFVEANTDSFNVLDGQSQARTQWTGCFKAENI